MPKLKNDRVKQIILELKDFFKNKKKVELIIPKTNYIPVFYPTGKSGSVEQIEYIRKNLDIFDITPVFLYKPSLEFLMRMYCRDKGWKHNFISNKVILLWEKKKSYTIEDYSVEDYNRYSKLNKELKRLAGTTDITKLLKK